MFNGSLFVYEKLISAVTVLALIAILSPDNVVNAFVVLGHAHFALSYLYQYKAGKMKVIYLIPYVLLVIAFFGFRYFDPIIFMLFVATFFLFHNFFDEFKLRSEKPTVEFSALIILLTGLIVGWIVDFFMATDNALAIFGGAGAVSCFLLIAKFFKSKTVSIPWNNAYFWYLSLLLIIFLGMELTGHRPDARESFGFIVLMHYMTWYIRLGTRFWVEKGGKFNVYLRDTAIANAVFIAGYYIVVVELERQGILYEGIYRPLGFYVWTLMHLVTTLRLSDYQNAFRFSTVRG